MDLRASMSNALNSYQDIYRRRKLLRHDLISKRVSTDIEIIRSWNVLIDKNLLSAFSGFLSLKNIVLGLCWPFKHEYDGRFLARRLRLNGTLTALPVIVHKDEPLQFRSWKPGDRMKIGSLGIKYPIDTELLTPDIYLLPFVGFDQNGYRLGYGGGYFDRTLASLTKKPLVIGVGHEISKIKTIEPLAHDIAMDYVVTELGVYKNNDKSLELLNDFKRRSNDQNHVLSSPVCYQDQFLF